jgi:Spy/CpxP family protein refolding chaperone
MRSHYVLALASLALTVTLSATVAAQTSPNSSSSQTAPRNQTGSAGDAQQKQSSGQGSSIDDELQLNQDQRQKIAAVVDDEKKQLVAVGADTSLTVEQKQQEAMQIRQAGATQIRSYLTPEQLQKLATIQEREKQKQENNTGAPPPQHH